MTNASREERGLKKELIMTKITNFGVLKRDLCLDEMATAISERV